MTATKMARRFNISIAPQKQTVHWREQPPMTWTEFTGWLNLQNPHGTKDCGGYFLGVLQDGLKRKETIISRSAVTLDADKAATGFTLDLSLSLPDIAYALHTTFHHSPEAPRYRVIIPLDRDVTPEEYVLIIKALITDLGAEQFDPTCTQPFRMMHLPSTLDRDTYHHEVIKGPGKRALKADEWIERAAELGLDADPEPEIYPGYGDFDPDSEPEPEQLNKAKAVLYKACREIRTNFDEKRGEPFAGRNDATIHWLPTLYRFVLGGVLEETEVDTEVFAAISEADGPHEFPLSEYQQVSISAWGYANADGPQRPEAQTAADDFALTHEIFDATPTLSHIRQAAQSRMVGPNALLCYTLARVLTELPPAIHLPPIIASKAPLNLGVAVVGGSGDGKSGLLSVSRELLGLTGTDQLDLERNVGSGEGVAETFLEPEYAPNAQTGRMQKTGRKILIADPRRILLADEVDALGATQNRSGATIAPVLRTALTGGPLGQENATADNRRHVPAGTYRLVFLIGVQPSRSEALLNDAMTQAGTPQRLVWVSVGDPYAPDENVEWPGALTWKMPYLPTEEISYPEHIKSEIQQARRTKLRNPADSDVTGHVYLTRLKVASALALLHEQTAINDRWWYLAGLIVTASMREQERCREALIKAVEKQHVARGRAQGLSRLAETEVITDDGIQRTAKAIKTRLTDEWISFSKLRHSLRKDHRPHAEDAIALLVKLGQVEIRQTTYKGQPGREVRGV